MTKVELGVKISAKGSLRHKVVTLPREVMILVLSGLVSTECIP